jgi:hypothetical protein
MIKEFLHSAICDFTVGKSVIIKDRRVGISHTFFKLFILGFILYDLFYKELYFKTEIPSGYTTMWAETYKLYEYQSNATIKTPSYCNNKKYNYIYSLPYWDYRNIDCINLHYSEMYEKGESEIFFMTFFTENHIKIKQCKNTSIFDLETCEIVDKLDGNCFCQNYKNFFTNGVEYMKLSFNHIYTTSFETGGNVADASVKPIKTIIEDSNGKKVREFKENENILLTIKEWLEYANVNLEGYNLNTKISDNGTNIIDLNHVKNRASGLEIILKVNYYNIKHLTERDETICKISVKPNYGWASKGSKNNYIKYPDIINDLANTTSEYVDRYRYGIKFKFIVSGLMGKFDFFMLINYLVSIIVLINFSHMIMTYIIMYTLGEKSKYYDKNTSESISYLEYKKTDTIIKEYFQPKVSTI